MLSVVPITQKEAIVFVNQVHRHLKAPRGSVFQVAVADEKGNIRGVAMVCKPVARLLSDGWTLEVSRLATDGCKNACSMLYAASWRAARALGYKKLVTYILDNETDVSLKAAGWKVVAKTKKDSWNRKNRPRIDLNPLQEKFRWEKAI